MTTQAALQEILSEYAETRGAKVSRTVKYPTTT
jgi:hypothetical protein